jgi:hypothetical protein
MGKFRDITGQKFGKIIAIKVVGVNKRGNKLWLVRHSCCGAESVKSQGKIIHNKQVFSCPNCNQHRMRKTRFYGIWHKMLKRCNNSNSDNFRYYGGRGIKVLWPSFIVFKNDMYESYLEHRATFGEKNTTIDRVDNSGHYCKENCRWATWHEQHTNTRRNRFITFNGLTLTIGDWARKLDIGYRTLGRRLDNCHWPVERTLTERPYAGKNQFSKN